MRSKCGLILSALVILACPTAQASEDGYCEVREPVVVAGYDPDRIWVGYESPIPIPVVGGGLVACGVPVTCPADHEPYCEFETRAIIQGIGLTAAKASDWNSQSCVGFNGCVTGWTNQTIPVPPGHQRHVASCLAHAGLGIHWRAQIGTTATDVVLRCEARLR